MLGRVGKLSKLSDEDWERLLRRRLAGECTRALAAEAGVSVGTVLWQAKKRGLRKCDVAGSVNLRARLPADAPDEARQHFSKLTEGQWRALAERYVAGEPIEALSAEYGVSTTRIMLEMKARGCLKRQRPDAVWRDRWGGATRNAGDAGLRFDFDPDDPGEGVKSALARAKEAAAEGRTSHFRELNKAAREAALTGKALARLGSAGAAAGEGVARNPGEPLGLHGPQRPPGGAWATWLFPGRARVGEDAGGGAVADRAGAGPCAAGAGGADAARRARGDDRRPVGAAGAGGRGAAAVRAVAAAAGVGERGAGVRLFGGGPGEPARAAVRGGVGGRVLRVAQARRDAGDAAHGPAAGGGPAAGSDHDAEADPGAAAADRGGVDGADGRADGDERGEPCADVRGAAGGAVRRVAAGGAGAGGRAAGGAGGGPVDAGAAGGVPGARPGRLERVVVAVDPPAGGADGSACGIVVAGACGGRGYVLADRSARGLSPGGWAAAAVAAARAFGASRIVAEANQGGDMVRTVLAAAGGDVPVKLVRASTGKRARAEPVATLYEQGRVTHCGVFAALEEEMTGLGAGAPAGAFDRADALVWALTELLLGPVREGPRVAVL